MLTDREREILPLVAHGFSRKQMSTVLGIRFYTLKTTLERLYEKIGARNMGDAVRLGYQWGFVTPCTKTCKYCELLAHHDKDGF